MICKNKNQHILMRRYEIFGYSMECGGKRSATPLLSATMQRGQPECKCRDALGDLLEIANCRRKVMPLGRL